MEKNLVQIELYDYSGDFKRERLFLTFRDRSFFIDDCGKITPEFLDLLKENFEDIYKDITEYNHQYIIRYYIYDDLDLL